MAFPSQSFITNVITLGIPSPFFKLSMAMLLEGTHLWLGIPAKSTGLLTNQ